MILVPRHNLYLPRRLWPGDKARQCGTIALAAAGPSGIGQLKVSLDGGNVINVINNATCFAGVRFNTDGTEQASTNNGTWSVSRGRWLDAGQNDQVWIERTVNSGSLDWQDSGAGRLQLTSDRLFGLMALEGAGIETVGITFDAYDAASGGSLLDTKTLTLSGEGIP